MKRLIFGLTDRKLILLAIDMSTGLVSLFITKAVRERPWNDLGRVKGSTSGSVCQGEDSHWECRGISGARKNFGRDHHRYGTENYLADYFGSPQWTPKDSELYNLNWQRYSSMFSMTRMSTESKSETLQAVAYWLLTEQSVRDFSTEDAHK